MLTTGSVERFLTLLFFFAGDAKSGRRTSLEPAKLDVLAAFVAFAEGAFFDSSKSFFDFLDIERLPIAQSHPHGLLDIGGSLIDVIVTIIGTHSEVVAHDPIIKEQTLTLRFKQSS